MELHEWCQWKPKGLAKNNVHECRKCVITLGGIAYSFTNSRVECRYEYRDIKLLEILEMSSQISDKRLRDKEMGKKSLKPLLTLLQLEELLLDFHDMRSICLISIRMFPIIPNIF